jgi:choline-glycine betaine transporter
MQFLYGLLTAVVFFIVLLAVFYVGYKRGKQTHVSTPIPTEEKKKMEKFNKHFQALFTYDVDTALQKKKVT